MDENIKECLDELQEASKYISELEGKIKNVLKIIEERSIFDTPEDIYHKIEWELEWCITYSEMITDIMRESVLPIKELLFGKVVKQEL